MPGRSDEIEQDDSEKEGEDGLRPDKIEAQLTSKFQNYLRDYRQVFRPFGAISGGDFFLSKFEIDVMENCIFIIWISGLFLMIYGGQQMGWVINMRISMQMGADEDFIANIGSVWFLYGILGALLSLSSLMGTRTRWIYVSF
jgi:hypothetical protein